MSEDESPGTNSSFDGNIEEIPEISVDNFRNKSKMAYFLSHMHLDHTEGLFGAMNSSRLRSNGSKIYMSEESKIILSHHHWHYDNLEDLVEPLKKGIPYTIDLPDDKSFQVILIPATHMIGAVMFLFKTKEKTALFTGDFVMDEDQLSDQNNLHDKNGNPIKLDALYVDSTFDNIDYVHFPSRESAEEQVIDKTDEWLQTDNHKVALYSNYQFGYDDIYRSLHNRLGKKIFVRTPDDRASVFEVYEALYGVTNFLTEDSNSKIHICKEREARGRHNTCGVPINTDDKYIHIYMSATLGCNYDPQLETHSALSELNPNSYYLCYQTHCSKTQLDHFINYFNPDNTTNTVRFPRRTVQAPPSSNRTPYKRRRQNDNNDRDHVRRQLNF